VSISTTEWKRLGLLANVEPLEQGRHRGKHAAGRRIATAEELEEARGHRPALDHCVRADGLSRVHWETKQADPLMCVEKHVVCQRQFFEQH